jgi:hypothetical protein
MTVYIASSRPASSSLRSSCSRLCRSRMSLPRCSGERVLEQCGRFGGEELGGQRVQLGGLRCEQRRDVVRETDVERAELAVDEEPVFGLLL